MGINSEIMGKQWAFTETVKIGKPKALSTKGFAGIENVSALEKRFFRKMVKKKLPYFYRSLSARGGSPLVRVMGLEF